MSKIKEALSLVLIAPAIAILTGITFYLYLVAVLERIEEIEEHSE